MNDVAQFRSHSSNELRTFRFVDSRRMLGILYTICQSLDTYVAYCICFAFECRKQNTLLFAFHALFVEVHVLTKVICLSLMNAIRNYIHILCAYFPIHSLSTPKLSHNIMTWIVYPPSWKLKVIKVMNGSDLSNICCFRSSRHTGKFLIVRFHSLPLSPSTFGRAPSAHHIQRKTLYMIKMQP